MGDWPGLLRGREQICCPAGSVVHFSEATIHAGVAVLADQPRYALFFSATRDCDGRTDRRLGWRDPAVGPWGPVREAVGPAAAAPPDAGQTVTSAGGRL